MLTSDIKAIALDLAQAHVDYHAAILARDETAQNICYARLIALQNGMSYQAEAIAEQLLRRHETITVQRLNRLVNRDPQ